MSTGPVAGAIFDHVAHAAPRIRDLLGLYRDALGGELFHAAENPVGFRLVQLVFPDKTKIELLEPLDGSPFLDKFLERSPAGGLHHITFRVPDLDAAIESARRADYHVFGVDGSRPFWKEAFLHPRVAHGALVQLAEVAPWFPPRMPMDEIEAILARAA